MAKIGILKTNTEPKPNTTYVPQSYIGGFQCIIMVHVVDLEFNVGIEYMYLTVDNPYSVAFVIYTLIFQWYVIKYCGPKNIHHKGMVFKEIGLRAKSMISS